MLSICKSTQSLIADNTGLARSIGPHAAALADLVKDTPPGSEKLLLQMLSVLTGKTGFSMPFCLACIYAVAVCGRGMVHSVCVYHGHLLFDNALPTDLSW